MQVPGDETAAIVTRGGVIESVHRAHIVVCGRVSEPVAITGQADTIIYPRSALKPLQTLAVRHVLTSAGITMTDVQMAMASASHVGGDTHQIEAAAMLAEAGLDERALQCPPDWPLDDKVRLALLAKTSLSHNCSGKHAAMLWAHTVEGEPPATYLQPDTPLQQEIKVMLTSVLGEEPEGPGVDGCGAPAWRCSAGALARGFATLGEGRTEGTKAVRDAMVAFPELVGGGDLHDTALMWYDSRIVAKRGADGVMACAFNHETHGWMGVVVKVIDGSDRAAGPLAATVLHALGAVVPTDVMRPPVMGGGEVQGAMAAAPHVAASTTTAFGLA